MVTIAEQAEVLMGQSPPSSTCSEKGEGIPFIQGNAEFGVRHPAPRLKCSSPTRLAEAGDLLLSVRAPVGELNQAVEQTVIGRGLSALRFNPNDQGYAWHAVNWSSRALNRVAQGSTFVAVSRQDVEKLEIPWHGADNVRIAYVLDTVDKAIATSEAVIAKLKQVRAGMLHDLLTCGLDENGELRDPIAHPEQFKDSPLGRIPKEWEVSNLGDLSTFITSGSRGWANYYSDDGPIFLRIGNLTREHINLRFNDIVRVSPPSGSEGARTKVQSGDVLISITADLGIIGVIPPNFEEAYVNQHIALVRPIESICSGWVGRYLSFGPTSTFFRMLNDSGAKAGMNLKAIESLLLALPSIEEQKATTSALDTIDEDIFQQLQSAKKYHLLKSGLMADLLTGAVRVPEEVVFSNGTLT